MPLLPYDIFEVRPNGSLVPRGSVNGLEAAWKELYELAKHTANECFAIYPPTREVVAQVNVPPAKERASKRVFQVAYTEELGIARAEVLTRRGYQVTTVIGNQRAKVVLASAPPYNIFLIGHGAPHQTRVRMAIWLKSKYPDVKILALNPVSQHLREADYNVVLNGPEKWVPIVAKATEFPL